MYGQGFKCKYIIKAQNKLIKDFQNIKAGPNTDLLYEKKYRLEDNCHFSLLGLDKFSDMFIKAHRKSYNNRIVCQNHSKTINK